MSRQSKEMIIWSACSVGLIVICLLWISTIPEGTPGILNKEMASITEATMTDVATATDSEPQTYYKRYGIEPQIEYESVNNEEYRPIPSPVLSERKEPKLEVEIVTTEEMTTEEVVYEEPEIEVEEVEVVEVSSPDGMTYIGEFCLTAYAATGSPCADGAMPSEWYTVACNDPALWHRTIYIEGYGTFYVHDRGGMPSYNILDVYLGDYDSCIQFGRQYASVYLVE